MVKKQKDYTVNNKYRRQTATLIMVIAAILLGCTGLAGWLFDSRTLRSIFSSDASMKWNTALLIIGTGVLLLLLQSEKRPKWMLLVTGGLIAVCLVLLSEHIFGINLGIDEWAVKDLDTLGASQHPGRTSALTAGMLLALLTAVAAGQTGWFRLSQLIGGLVFFCLYAVLMGHIFEEKTFYLSGRYSGMAFHTALAMLLLNTGLLLLYGDRGFMQVFTLSPKGRIGFKYLAFYIVSFLPVSAGIYRWLVLHNIFSETAAVMLVMLLSMIISIPVIYWTLTNINRVQESFNKIEQRMALALDAAQLGSFDVDLLTGKMSSNNWCKANFGFSSDDAFSYADMMAVVHPDFIVSLKDRIASAINKQQRFHAEYKIVLADSSHRWIVADGVPRYNAEGDTIALIGITDDITARKEAELNKDAFIGIASHELKTPLTTLKGYAQLVESSFQGHPDPFPLEALAKINLQVDKMTSMINNFLHVSRAGDAVLSVNKRIISLTKLLSGVLDEYQQPGKTAGRKIIRQYFPEIILQADAGKLEQVLRNLLDNAIKYSKAGGSIEIIVSRETAQVVIGIKDEGPGIATHHMPRLFERFYRVDNKENKHISGFGIGLYLSAAIIESHGGKIWVESKRNDGSVFYFTLPLTLHPTA